VILSREALLNLDSFTFDDYVRKVATSRELSSEEQKELKRQRRLIKNRESAQASRQRKKDYIDQLEEKVAKLTSDNVAMKERITALQTENKSLKDEVIYLHSVIKKNPGLSSLFQGMNYLGKVSKQGYSNNVKVAGVCLMIILFSFGLFFNSNNTPALPFNSVREPIPEVLPSSTGGRVLAEKFQPAGSSRKILTVSENVGEINTKRLEQSYMNRIEEDQKLNKMQHDPLEDKLENKLKRKLDKVVNPNEDNLPRKHLKQTLPVANDEKTIKQTLPITKNEITTEQALPVTNNEKTITSLAVQPHITNWKPNTTYLMCPDVQQITPPNNARIPEQANAPLMVAFLIPPDTFDSNSNSDGNSMIEVTCQVIDVNLIPIVHPSDNSVDVPA